MQIRVNRGSLDRVHVDLLHRDHVVASAKLHRVGTSWRKLTLERHRGYFHSGQHTLRVRHAHQTLLERFVTIA